MAPILYMTDSSPSVRSILITANVLGITLKKYYIDITAGENVSPWFLKLNPQHTVPTFVDDDGTVLWDSHAIMVYLVAKYGKDDSLYPVDPYKRALINQRLHFDSEFLFPPVRLTTIELFYKGFKKISPYITDAMNEAYGYLNELLEGHEWAVGNHITLADFSMITTVDLMTPIDSKAYPNIIAWVKRAETWPYYKENIPGLRVVSRFMDKFRSNKN